jgi:polar amino acid transport system permease protein
VILIDIYTRILPVLLQGTWVTLQITIYSAIVAFVFAFITGFGRLSSISLIRWVTTIVVEFLRGTSLLVQLF